MASLAQPEQQLVMVTGRLHEDALGELEFKQLRRQLLLCHRGLDVALQLHRSLELTSRQVHGDQWWRKPSVQPRSCLAAGLSQDPSPQGHDQALPFCISNKPHGGQNPILRMVPPDESFQTCDPTSLDVDLRLIQKKELLAGNGLA